MKWFASLFRLIVMAAMLAACTPLGPIPGGRLTGDVTPVPTQGWTMFASLTSLQLEVRPDDPHSVNLSCVVSNGRLYVGTGRAQRSVWARALLADPRARVKLGSALYEVRGVRVEQATEIQTYLDTYHLKFSDFGASVSEFQDTTGAAATAILFRLEPAE